MFAGEKCAHGFTSLWKFDQKNKQVSLDSSQKMNVCNFSSAQLSSNIEVQFLKKDKIILSMKVYWPNVTYYDTIKDGKYSGTTKKEDLYKILKAPINLESIERYIVKSLKTGDVLGTGAMK